MKKIGGGVAAPLGFKANGVGCGIKRSKRKDLALIASDRPCVAAGVFTANQIKASCVTFSQKQLRDGEAQAIIVNSGNANCLTGRSGYGSTVRLARAVADELHIESSGVLVGSTGVIGEPLPIKKILRAVPALAQGLSTEGSGDAAHAILTTDRIIKEIAVEIRIGRRPVRIGAIAKGAGMIHPELVLSDGRHATMLCYITTDALILTTALRRALERSVKKSFNMITVDADRSTNDMVIIMANGAAHNAAIRERTREFRVFSKALDSICLCLAKLIVKDAEGATKFVEISVKHAPSTEEARSVALSVASSNLVKCALFGSDPNWGRIAASIGNASTVIDPNKLQIRLGHEVVLRGGARIAQKLSKLHRIFSRKNVKISIDLGMGKHQVTVWTSDLSSHYVRINSSYRT